MIGLVAARNARAQEGREGYSAIDFTPTAPCQKQHPDGYPLSTPSLPATAAAAAYFLRAFCIGDPLRQAATLFVASTMGWLHSLFSPLRRMWVRAHSERRNRRGMHLLYKDVQSCQDEDVHILWSILIDSHRHPAVLKLKL